MAWLNIFNLVIGILFSVCYLYQYVYMILAHVKKPKIFPKTEHLHRFAILSSARNEETVIGQLCDSIRAQSYPASLIDVYVIADNCTDRTADVARAHGATVFERNDPEHVGKGYALQCALERIRRERGEDAYDGYFVIDADNLLDPDYVAEMNRAFSQGHRVVTSYRNSKNYGDNWISAGYSLWFLREARHLNAVRQLLGVGCVVAGTGFLIHKDIIKEQGGWKHFLMTEDIEFTAERILCGEKIAYCHAAVFYDEQPVSFRQSWRQRARWAKGYLQVLRVYGGRLLRACFKGNFSAFDLLMSLSPAYFISLLSVSVHLGALVYGAIAMPSALPGILTGLLIIAVSAYLLVLLVAVSVMLLERKRIHATVMQMILSVLTLPFFIATYIPISASAIFSRAEWKPIRHTVGISIDDLNQSKK